jgi:endonuclease/exonuclease/phosphatase family metal-dependent hydrolase
LGLDLYLNGEAEMTQRNMRLARLAGMVEAAAVLIIFFQALRVLFSVLFGLIYDALIAETVPMTTVGLVLILVIGALWTPLAAPRQPKTRRVTWLASAVLVFLARIPLALNDPQARLVASILIIAATGIYLALRLRQDLRVTVRALVLALVADQLLRAAGQTWDVTLRPEWWPGQVVVSLLLCLLAGWRFWKRPTGQATTDRPGWGLRAGLFWGGWLFLQMSLLAFPNAMARWSGEGYSVFASLLPLILLLTVAAEDLWRIRRGWIEGLLVLVILLAGLALGYLLTGLLAVLGLALAEGAAVALLFSWPLVPRQGRRDRLGFALALGGILYLILSFAYAFTFTYAYTLDLFRDLGLPVFLVAGLLTGLPVLGLHATRAPVSRPSRRRLLATLGVALVLILPVLAVAIPRDHPAPAMADSFRVATYNIHYGYDTFWHSSLEAQAQTIEASEADVVMLQEVDTGRPTSYLIDDAMWLARRLGMNEVYLPALEHLTGIALLSRHPILDADRLLLPSELEQTGMIWAELDVSGQPVNAFAIWMGLEPEERARQLDAALPFINAHPGPAVFGGDFNTTPDSPVYARIQGAGFVDPFVSLGYASSPTDPAINPTRQVDFVWLRDLPPLDAQVLGSTSSDHRLVVVEVGLPGRLGRRDSE